MELAPGSRLSPLPGGWRLEAGQAWWTCLGGSPVRLEVGGLALETRGPATLGLRLLEVPPASAAWTDLLLGKAEAAPQSLAEVWVEEGVVRILTGGDSVEVQAGSRWCGGEPGARRASVAERAAAFAWRESLGSLSEAPPSLLGSVRAEGSGWAFQGPGSLLCSPPPGTATRLTLVLASIQAPVSAGVSCQLGGEAAVWELPASLWDGRAHRLTVEASSLGVRVLIDGITMRAMGREAFRSNQLAASPGTGLVVWGGQVRVSSSTLRMLDR